MKPISVVIMLLIAKVDFGQDSLICRNTSVPSVNATLYINGRQEKPFISLEKIKGDLVLGLNDTSYRIVGFRFFLPCPSDGSILWDMLSKTYNGNSIKSTDPILRNIKVGGFISFECITVEKNGTRFSINKLAFQIVE